MNTVRRALRSIVRGPLRTGLLVAVLAVSVGLTLIMITVNAAFSERLDEIRSEVGSDVTIQPAGSFGGGFFRGAFQGPPEQPGENGAPAGGEPAETIALSDTLADEDIDQLWSIAHVVNVSRTMTVPYTGGELVSGVQPPEGAPAGFAQFRRPVLVTGTDTPDALTTVGVGDVELVAGRTFDDDEIEATVAVIGSALADANSLVVGDTFEMSGASIEVVGIFTSGTQFGDNSVFLPLAAAQELFEREGEVDQAVVRAESVDHVEQVATSIRDMLGEDTVDVSTQQSLFAGISAPLADAKDSSRIGMIAALVASAAVILFSVGLVARQRVKEIGILKSIGASNWHVTAQFGIETAVVSVIAALLGALATFPLAQSVADGLVSDPAAPQGPGGFARAGGQVARGGGQFQGAGGLLGDIDVAVSPEVFLYALGIAVALAIVASIVPAWYVGRVKPAEVLRHE